MTIDELAKTAYLAGEPDAVSTLWDREANPIRKKWLGVSAAILAIPEIKEGQELREKRDKLVELDEDQFPPVESHPCPLLRSDGHGGVYRVQSVYEKVWGEVRDAFIAAGFRRVKVKE